MDSKPNNLPKVPPLVPPRAVKPWDLLNKNIGRVSAEVKEERLNFCRSCPFYMKLSHQCRKCGCFMDAKTLLPGAYCPEGHWGAVEEVEE